MSAAAPPIAAPAPSSQAAAALPPVKLADITLSEPVFRDLCAKAGAAVGALSACETREVERGNQAAAQTIRGVRDDLSRAIRSAVADWGPAAMTVRTIAEAWEAEAKSIKPDDIELTGLVRVFELTEPHEARLASVTPRVEKHGGDEVPAVSIALEIETSNTVLDLIDPTIRHALYKAKSDDTPELPGVEASTPVLRCNSFERCKLTTSHEGWALHVHTSVDEHAPPMAFGGVKVDNFSVQAKQGGTVVLRFRCGTSDVDAKRIGWLGVHNGQAIEVSLHAPKVPTARPEDEGGKQPTDTGAPLLEAGDAFAAAHAGSGGGTCGAEA